MGVHINQFFRIMMYKNYLIQREDTICGKNYNVYQQETNDGGRTWKFSRTSSGYRTIREAKDAINAHFGRL